MSNGASASTRRGTNDDIDDEDEDHDDDDDDDDNDDDGDDVCSTVRQMIFRRPTVTACRRVYVVYVAREDLPLFALRHGGSAPHGPRKDLGREPRRQPP